MSTTQPFIWHELVTPDQDASGAFFCALLGWQKKTVDAGAFGAYTLFQKEGKDIAGMMNPTPDSPHERAHWHPYIAVDDVNKCAEEATRLGGRVVVPPHDVPGVGRICVVADPMGAIADVLQPVSTFAPQEPSG